jgi:hypothetical protein
MPKGLRLREGWLSFILLLLLLGTVTVSLQAADWTDGLGLLTPVMLMGLLVGVLFAKSGLPGLLLHPFALLMGMEWIAFLSFSLVEDAPWREQLTEIVQRLSVWGERISSGASNPDNLPFILVMAGLMWLIAYVAAWSFYRNHNIWGALLPTGVTILVNTYYGPSELNAILVVFVVLAFSSSRRAGRRATSPTTLKSNSTSCATAPSSRWRWWLSRGSCRRRLTRASSARSSHASGSPGGGRSRNLTASSPRSTIRARAAARGSGAR